MSFYFDQMKKDPIAKEIDPKESRFSGRKSEGSPYLFFDENEVEDLMGREIQYFENGVLLVLRDKHKPFPSSKNFAFFNNNGQNVFHIKNTKYEYDSHTRLTVAIEPKFDIDVQITKHYIHVVETDFETKETKEYYVNVATGNKLFDIFETHTPEASL